MIGSLGLPELLFILVVALLIFGPRKLPEIGRTIGKALGEFRRATSDLKRTLDVEMSMEEEKSPPPRNVPGVIAPERQAPAAGPDEESGDSAEIENTGQAPDGTPVVAPTSEAGGAKSEDAPTAPVSKDGESG